MMLRQQKCSTLVIHSWIGLELFGRPSCMFVSVNVYNHRVIYTHTYIYIWVGDIRGSFNVWGIFLKINSILVYDNFFLITQKYLFPGNSKWWQIEVSI